MGELSLVRHIFFALLNTHFGLSWGTHTFPLSLKHWINDGLMALFFFVVGLEIKREIVFGRLSAPGKAAPPIASASGGMMLSASSMWLLHTS